MAAPKNWADRVQRNLEAHIGTWGREVWNVAMGRYSDTGMRSMGSGHVKYLKYLLMSVIIVTCTCLYTCQDGA